MLYSARRMLRILEEVYGGGPFLVFFFFFKTITPTLNFRPHTCSTNMKFLAAHLLHAVDAFLGKFLLFQARSLQSFDTFPKHICSINSDPDAAFSSPGATPAPIARLSRTTVAPQHWLWVDSNPKEMFFGDRGISAVSSTIFVTTRTNKGNWSSLFVRTIVQRIWLMNSDPNVVFFAQWHTCSCFIRFWTCHNGDSWQLFGLGLLMTEQAEWKLVAQVGASVTFPWAWHWTTVDFWLKMSMFLFVFVVKSKFRFQN